MIKAHFIMQNMPQLDPKILIFLIVVLVVLCFLTILYFIKPKKKSIAKNRNFDEVKDIISNESDSNDQVEKNQNESLDISEEIEAYTNVNNDKEANLDVVTEQVFIDDVNAKKDNDVEIAMVDEEKEAENETNEVRSTEDFKTESIEPNKVMAFELESKDGEKRKVRFVRYRRSFVAQLLLKEHLIPIYKEIKDEILSYKGVKSRLSFKGERFSIGRKTLIRMCVRGKRLYIYYALNPQEIEEKFHVIDVSDKKIGEQLPTLQRVLSNRSVSYAKRLINILMQENDMTVLDADKVVKTDYDSYLCKKSFEDLIAERSIIEYYVEQEVEDDYDISTYNSFLDDEDDDSDISVSLEEANNQISDSLIERKIQKSSKKHGSGKLHVINLAVLSKEFANDDFIDLEALKEKRLLPKNATRYKVLASGILDKTLNIEADDFSKEAMKMIIYLGGSVSIIK